MHFRPATVASDQAEADPRVSPKWLNGTCQVTFEALHCYCSRLQFRGARYLISDELVMPTCLVLCLVDPAPRSRSSAFVLVADLEVASVGVLEDILRDILRMSLIVISCFF